jgi:DNA-binding Lrp family transcriptional regulator
MDRVAARVLPVDGLGSGGLRMALLNRWQRGFPLDAQPYATIGAALGVAECEVIDAYGALQREGFVSRIGGVFGAGAGGSAMLCAMAVPAPRLEEVARIVCAHPGVNHNYEREHPHNLWFVITGPDARHLERDLCALEAATGCAALRLRMQRAYVIDLGFDLTRTNFEGPERATTAPDCEPVPKAERLLAALVEQGLPLQPLPFDAWGARLGWTGERVRATLARWLERGTLRRFGVVVRHHELGIAANAMTVFDVPDAEVDARGAALARCAGVTLAYRRTRALGWPYNLYCMVHGRDRAAVHDLLARAVHGAGLEGVAREVLFSTRRFKQCGARYFRDALPEARDAR